MQHFDYLKFFPKLKKFQKVKYLLLGENPNPNPEKNTLLPHDLLIILSF